MTYPSDALPPSDLQKSLVAATAARRKGAALTGDELQGQLAEMKTRGDCAAYLRRSAKRAG